MRFNSLNALLVVGLVVLGCGGDDTTATTEATTTSSATTSTGSQGGGGSSSSGMGGMGGMGGQGGQAQGGGGAGGDPCANGGPNFGGTCNNDTDCGGCGVCFTFGMGGKRCTIQCTTAADCPAPATQCNGMGVCGFN